MIVCFVIVLFFVFVFFLILQKLEEFHGKIKMCVYERNLKGLIVSIFTSLMAPKKIPLSAAIKVTEPLSEEDLLKLVVPGLGSAARPTLDDWGYNGGAAAFLGLALDNTNLLVQYGNLYLLGQLFDD